jgi:hypothetical protein
MGIQAKFVLYFQAHPRRMHDNDGDKIQAWHDCGQDDELWETHAYEVES